MLGKEAQWASEWGKNGVDEASQVNKEEVLLASVGQATLFVWATDLGLVHYFSEAVVDQLPHCKFKILKLNTIFGRYFNRNNSTFIDFIKPIMYSIS